jgi:urease accessory protein
VRRDALPALGTTAVAAGWRAELALAFDSTARGTRLAMQRHRGPLVVQRALYPEGPAVCHAIVVHPPGGIAGGDELAIDVAVAPGAHAVLTTPGAAKLYKGAGRSAAQDVRLRVDGIVEWLPQETIVYDAALATLGLALDVARGGFALAWDVVTLGREAMGERFESGSIDSALDVAIGGEPVVFERGRVDGGSAWLASPVGWRSARTCGTLVAAGRRIDDALVDGCRESIAPWSPRAAVSRLTPDCLVGRYLGASAAEGRAVFEALRAALRPALCGRSAAPLRIWAT